MLHFKKVPIFDIKKLFFYWAFSLAVIGVGFCAIFIFNAPLIIPPIIITSGTTLLFVCLFKTCKLFYNSKIKDSSVNKRSLNSRFSSSDSEDAGDDHNNDLLKEFSPVKKNNNKSNNDYVESSNQITITIDKNGINKRNFFIKNSIFADIEKCDQEDKKNQNAEEKNNIAP